jgi:NTP pyrophosphatase (non-canonical NTP hydrolase)
MTKSNKKLIKPVLFLTTDSKHGKMVAALSKPGKDILKSLTPEKCEIIHMILGLFTEVGELGDAIKKWTMYEKELDFANVEEELGDIEFFKTRIHQMFNINRERALIHNLNKLAERYKGYKYSNQRAHDRADKRPK